MQKMKNNKVTNRKTTVDTAYRNEINHRLHLAVTKDSDALLQKLGTTMNGLNQTLVEESRIKYGDNNISHGKRHLLFEDLEKLLSIRLPLSYSYWLWYHFSLISS